MRGVGITELLMAAVFIAVTAPIVMYVFTGKVYF